MLLKLNRWRPARRVYDFVFLARRFATDRAWQEASEYSHRDCAALAWAEAVTLQPSEACKAFSKPLTNPKQWLVLNR
jgi:hypothetical protein